MYLVTGGAGFIGIHTVAALAKDGHRVRVLDDLSAGNASGARSAGAELLVGSIEDPDAVAEAMADVTHVIHLAAKVSVPESWSAPLAFDRTNVGGFLQVLHHAHAAGVARVVYASSCAVYGSLPGLPKRESDPLAPESPYAATKLANEAYASAWARGQGLVVVGLRYFNVFGPGQDPMGPYGAVIPRFVESALSERRLVFHGDGEQGRDFVSVYDVARANVAASRADDVSGRVFNVGGGRMMTINGLAEVVSEVTGRPVRRDLQPARTGDVRFSLADISAAREHLGWSPQEDFHRALAATATWFKDRAAVSHSGHQNG